MPGGTRSRDQVVDVLIDTFRREGVDGATLTVLSEATGLGRSSLYHHFPGGKADMEEQVVTRVDLVLRCEVIEPLRERSVAPAARIDRMLVTMDRIYEGGARRCIVERLCASSGRAPDDRLTSIVVDWIAALSDTLAELGVAEPEAVAEDAVACLQGALILCDATRSAAPFRRVTTRLAARLSTIAGLPR